MLTKYAPLWALASTALAAPLACDADSPLVTVTTYITGYPPESSSTSTSVSTSTSTSVPPGFEGYEDTPAAAVTEQPTVYAPSTFATVVSSVASVQAPPAPTYVPTVPSAPPPPPPPASVVPVPSSTPNTETPSHGKSGTASMTPHEQYSSSVGVVGCKINHNRVAYWPMFPDVNRYCVKVTRGERSLNLLHIDQSGGAHDISYDAWNYLVCGKSVKEAPHCGGGVEMEYEWVDNKECADLILTGDGRLPLVASNPDLALQAPEPQGDYVSLWNFKDMRCERGRDEKCELPDYAMGYNQAVCPSGLGAASDFSGVKFEDIKYNDSLAGCTKFAG